MQVGAKITNVRISAQKCRLVANQIRGISVDKAMQVLEYSPKKASGIVKKLLESAIANAEHNEGADIDELKVSRIMVDEGPTYKRFRARAKGRGTRVLKRTSHITITVGDE